MPIAIVRFSAPLIVLWLAPVIVFMLVIPRANSQEETTFDPATSKTAIVGARLQELKRSVRVEVKLNEAPVVLASGPGLVTSVSIVPGNAVTLAERIASIDGVGVIAAIGVGPFYRDLSIDSSGEDVRQLKSLLDAFGLGAAEEASDRFTARTRMRVSELQTALGAKVDGVFRSTYTWYIPIGFKSPVDVRIRPGQPIAKGETVLVSSPSVASMSLVSEDPSQTLQTLSDAPLMISTAGREVSLSMLSPGQDEANKVWSQLESIAPGTRVAAAESNGTATETFHGLTLALAQPFRVGTVPRSAFLTTSTGAVCVYTVPQIDVARGIKAVLIPPGFATGVDINTGQIPADLIGTRVLVNAADGPKSVQGRCG